VRLLPASLVGRMTLLVAGVGLLSLVMHIALMALWLNAFVGDMASTIAGRVQVTARLLLQASPAERDSLASQLGDARFHVQRQVVSSAVSHDRLPPMAGDLVTALLAKLPPGSEVHPPRSPAMDPMAGLTLVVPMDGETWAFRQRLEPPVQAVLGTGLGWLLLVAVAVFASLALGVRFIARPITVLAERLLAQGSRISPVQPVSSATEIQVLTTAFNRLATSVQQADEDRQHLLAGVSHDLRTPLARLRLRIETQLDGEIAEELLAEADALERIVGQFLAYVQGDSGASLGQPDAVASVVQHVVATYAAQDLPVEVVPGGPAVEWPDLALQRVLTNLIDNALAHGRAPVKVALSEQWGASGREAVLAVSDAGPGMNADEFLRAQQPFVRLGDEVAGSLGHCGLGLAIVARLAHQRGARLERGDDLNGRFAVRLIWPISQPAASQQVISHMEPIRTV
jgi:two-component system, OmpR family, osmolarity sensor histidine kinase EnvZ